jgi:hypothetical protein
MEHDREEGLEVSPKLIDPRGKAGFKTTEGFDPHSQLTGHLLKRPLLRANQQRLKAVTIDQRQDQQQHAFSAANLSGVVVEKYLHLGKPEVRDQKSEITC